MIDQKFDRPSNKLSIFYFSLNRLSLFYLSLFIVYFLPGSVSAQSISGTLSLLAEQEIKLEGFDGLKTYPISNVHIDNNGYFNVSYSESDYGVGYLISDNEKPFIVILSGEDIEIQGESLQYPETLFIRIGKQNQWFGQYAREQPRREQALSAWTYLEKIYKQDSLFAIQKTPKQSIQQEKERIKAEEEAFLECLPKDSYVSWYLSVRKLVSSVSVVAQYRIEEIPITVEAFRKLDYTDQRLYKSGLFKNAIESHFWLLENSGPSLDSVYIKMQYSIDALIENLVKDEHKLNEVTEYLFDLLERHSLFQASEYLALKVLNEENCTIDSDLAKRLESYRIMKIGNTAPDIVFNRNYSVVGGPSADFPWRLSDLNSRLAVVVFGASWCPKCSEELSEIAKNYDKWKAQGVEVVFVSLDEHTDDFRRFVSDFPFISICDYQKWDGNIVKEYFVFATPTMYLLNKQRKILLCPASVNQLDAWLDWYLVQGHGK